jgi:hypothetical protein
MPTLLGSDDELHQRGIEIPFPARPAHPFWHPRCAWPHQKPARLCCQRLCRRHTNRARIELGWPWEFAAERTSEAPHDPLLFSRVAAMPAFQMRTRLARLRQRPHSNRQGRVREHFLTAPAPPRASSFRALWARPGPGCCGACGGTVASATTGDAPLARRCADRQQDVLLPRCSSKGMARTR